VEVVVGVVADCWVEDELEVEVGLVLDEDEVLEELVVEVLDDVLLDDEEDLEELELEDLELVVEV